MKSLTVWRGHSTRPSLPAGTARKASGHLSGRRPLHLANARLFGRLKAPLGLSLLRCAAQTRACLWQAEQAHHTTSKEKQSVPDGERPVVHIAIVCGFRQGASAGRTLFFVLYKWLSSLRKPKRCYLRSGQTQQSRTRHYHQCGCRHAHRRSFRQRHTNRGSHSPAYQEPLRLC